MYWLKHLTRTIMQTSTGFRTFYKWSQKDSNITDKVSQWGKAGWTTASI